MNTNQQRETDKNLIKFNLEPATEQEADVVADRVMKRLCHADNNTLRDICFARRSNSRDDLPAMRRADLFERGLWTH